MIQPQNIDAEKSVIGSMLISPAATDEALTNLSIGDFYESAHGRIFDTISKLVNSNKKVDTVTVIESLTKGKLIKACGGAYYITGLSDAVPTTANIKSYIKIVKDKALSRRLIELGHKLQDDAYRDTISPEELLNSIESSIFNISAGGEDTDFVPVSDLVHKSIDMIETISKSGNHVIGIPTGFIELDKYTLGFQKSDMIVIAGRPSMGKTSLAMNCATYAGKQGKKVGIFSIEMSNERLADRLLFSESGINSYNALQGKLSKDSWKSLNDSAGSISDLPIYINNTINADVLNVRSQARRLKRKIDVDMIIIDYIQQMYLSGKGYTGNQEMTLISRHIKAMAKELNIPVIAISQLSRAVEQRTDKSPILSDLRESGSLEQDADVVVLLYQPYRYTKEEEDKGYAKCEVAKHRNGKIGQFKLTWDEDTTTFSNYSGFEL